MTEFLHNMAPRDGFPFRGAFSFGPGVWDTGEKEIAFSFEK